MGTEPKVPSCCPGCVCGGGVVSKGGMASALTRSTELRRPEERRSLRVLGGAVGAGGSRHAPPHPALPAAPQEANYYGSLTQAGTVSLGLDAEGQEVFVPFSSLLPMVAPDDLVFDGGRGPRQGVGVGGGVWRGPCSELG